MSNNSGLQNFLSTYFAPAGGELTEVPKDQLQTNPMFLNKLNDTVVREFVTAVIDIWPDLTRMYTGSANCTGCSDSFIPVNRTFVVAGGRFREPYYWDSFWILQGLLRTGGAFTQISKNIIENFLDLVDQFGFVPNGARVGSAPSPSRKMPQVLSLKWKHKITRYTISTGLSLQCCPRWFELMSPILTIRASLLEPSPR